MGTSKLPEVTSGFNGASSGWLVGLSWPGGSGWHRAVPAACARGRPGAHVQPRGQEDICVISQLAWTRAVLFT